MHKDTGKKVRIRPVILSGGSGERLWPLSRRQHPKQFAPMLQAESLFAATLKRVSDRSRYGAPVIVGNTAHKFFILEALDALHITDAILLLEPMGRNTAAAAIIAALSEKERHADILHLVMPCDHIIADEPAFHAAVDCGAQSARSGAIVLFGMTPAYPETGYGYMIAEATSDAPVQKIARFHEKPDQAHAQALIEKGALWNSGIFLYAPSVLCEETKQRAPEYYKACLAAWHNAGRDNYATLLSAEVYGAMQSHAFDTLIMETTQRGAMLPCSIGWSDVGSWQVLWQLAEKDSDGNALIGSVVAKDMQSSYVRSAGPTVVALGMQGCMIVATKDAVLVAPRSRSQEVKALLPALEQSHNGIATVHSCVPRPWGTYENIADGQNFRVKHVVVRPGRALSLQMHHHRAEHWVVVAGTAKVECDGTEKLVFPNESVFIPKGAKHRLSNPGRVDLQLIEVQSGDHISEDDIIRFEDLYGRAPEAAPA